MKNRIGKKASEGKEPVRKSIVIALIVLGTLLLLGGVLFAVMSGRGGGEKSTEDSSSDWISFLPIWVAVFVPTIIRKKSGEQKLNPKEQRLLLIIGIALAVSALAGLAVVLLSV